MQSQWIILNLGVNLQNDQLLDWNAQHESQKSRAWALTPTSARVQDLNQEGMIVWQTTKGTSVT